jgi:hypothetical protein
MENELPSAELPINASFVLTLGQSALEGEKLSQADRTGVVRRDRGEAALRDARDIARAELALRRRRLGTLTREQEVGIENLLMSMVTRISELAERVPEASPMVS